ncbi:Scarecrow-like protein 28 [Linum grandiflorum]
MLAGCSSSSLLSPRHRLRSESSSAASAAAAATAQFPACQFQLPSMSTQRLDLPCTFPRKETSRSQSIRPVGVSVDNRPLDSKTSRCSSLKQNIRLPPLATTTAQSVRDDFWDQRRNQKKRFSEQEDDDETNRSKRKKYSNDHGEDGRVCYVPSEVISPPMPLSNNPWVDSVITQITDLGGKDGEGSQRRPGKEASGSSSTSSESASLGLRLSERNPEEHEVGNGSSNPHPQHNATTMEAAEEEDQDGEVRGLELVSLLTSCVEAIGSKNVAMVNHFISKLGELASPKGSPISRLSAYYTEALALRVTRIWPQVFHLTTPRDVDRVEDDSGTALRIMNQVSPIPKFIHFTANEILLRAFEGKDKVHIIDFDIKQGLQWPSFFQSLASRCNPPSHVRITGVGESKQELNETGDRLAGFAEALNLPFEFHPVVDRLEDVRLWMLHVKEGESVAVNCLFQMHKILYDTNGVALRDFMGLIKSTNPVTVIMAEQEAEHNGPSLESRVCNSLRYYSAVFDSIDSGLLPLESPVRIKMEEMFAREIRNVVSCEGIDRVERHEKFEKWRSLMEQGGFRSVGISEREFLQSQMLLKMYSCGNYGVMKQGGGGEEALALTLTWLGEPLYTVSAWTPVDVAGSSSSFSQP